MPRDRNPELSLSINSVCRPLPDKMFLSPGLIIAVERPSEIFANRYAEENDLEYCTVIYFSRRRDAHKKRKNLLEKLRKRFRS